MGRLSKKDLLEIVGKRKIKAAVETGIWKGDQLKVLIDTFDVVFGVELDKHYLDVCFERFKDDSLALFHGDTRQIIPMLSRVLNEPTIFLLDAHYCELDPPIEKSAFPLWHELFILAQRPKGDIVIVDDVHTFGKDRPDLRYKEGAKEWESVTPEEILKFFPKSKSKIIKDSFVIWT